MMKTAPECTLWWRRGTLFSFILCSSMDLVGTKLKDTGRYAFPSLYFPKMNGLETTLSRSVKLHEICDIELNCPLVWFIYQGIYLLPHAFLLIAVRSLVTSGSQSYWHWIINIHRIASEKEHTWEPTTCAFGGRNNGWDTKITKIGMYIAHSNHIRGTFIISLLLGKPLSNLNNGSELAA